jgi:type IV pilus assembly protein PilQ
MKVRGHLALKTVLFFLFSASIVLYFAFAGAQNSENVSALERPQEESVPQAQAPAVEAVNADTPKDDASKNVTLDFKDADIRNVLKILAFKSGVNIVATPDVVGNVNIRLIDVPWQKALDTIVKTYGFGYEWLNDRVIMVSTLTKLAEQRKSQEEASEKEPLDTQTFVLNFSNSENIRPVIEKLLSPRGKITEEKRTNMLLITDTKSNLAKIEESIKRLDKITPQVMIEARIVETTLGSTEKLGIDWNLRVALSGSKRPTTFPWTSEVKGTGTKMFPKVQVPSELSRVATTTYSETGTVVGTTTTETIFHQLVSGFPDAGTAGFVFGTLDMTGLQIVLDILKASADTKIIASPRITTLNNQEARILVGQRVPIPRYEYSKESGTMIISGYDMQEIGVKLIVTPNINEKDYVTLKVQPSVEDIIGSTGPNGERPIVSARSAETNVMIKDGQTLVIGGLISETKSKSGHGIPILGELPFLRRIFGNTNDSITKTELLIFITPHILREKMPMQLKNS